jgi:hypothetical protein
MEHRTVWLVIRIVHTSKGVRTDIQRSVPWQMNGKLCSMVGASLFGLLLHLSLPEDKHDLFAHTSVHSAPEHSSF